jgi:uncharacterized protein
LSRAEGGTGPMSFLAETGDGSLRCAVKAIPGSSRTQIQGLRGEELVVKLAAAPEKGKANSELIAFIAKSSGCPKSDIRIISGEHSSHKVLELSEKAATYIKEALGGLSAS